MTNAAPARKSLAATSHPVKAVGPVIEMTSFSTRPNAPIRFNSGI